MPLEPFPPKRPSLTDRLFQLTDRLFQALRVVGTLGLLAGAIGVLVWQMIEVYSGRPFTTDTGVGFVLLALAGLVTSVVLVALLFVLVAELLGRKNTRNDEVGASRHADGAR